ncbi:capsid assembly scaffolding protein Gp46 family protein [Limosilactobacillus caviae]|uniref:capsid assembly scaffolding protein Gp46 family protein n=1 Tax=Limosilactobacillus caviae TaxID=1769424 RepID=UPI003515D8E0
MDDNKNTEVENQTVNTNEEQPKEAGTDPKEDNKLDGDKLVKKLQKRIGKEQNEKHSLQDQLDKANAKIKELQSGKVNKDSLDIEATMSKESEKDKEIASLRAQIARRDNIKQTDEVFKEAGLTVSDDVLNMVVVDDEKQTYANVQALIKYTNQIQSGVKKDLLKGSTPRTNGKPTMTKDEINKIKDPIKRQQAIADNLSLYQH